MAQYVCPRCGAILGSQNPAACPYCRHQVGSHDQQRETPYDRALAEGLQYFAQRLIQLTPRVRATPVLLAINIGVFVVMLLFGGSLADPSAQFLFESGASRGIDTANGQWWRLLTCTFIHIGVIHVAFNMYCLYALGPLAERFVGSVGFVILYLASGLVGSLASAIWSPMVVSAGASGSLFGNFGGLVGIYVRAQRTIPTAVLQEHRSSLVGLLVINLIIGLTVPRIDMAGHIGGFVMGIVCGLSLGHPITREGAARRVLRNVLTAIGSAAIIVIFAIVVRERIGWIVGSHNELTEIERIESRVIDEFNHALDRSTQGQIDKEQFAAVIERDILPAWTDVRQRLDRVRVPPDIDRQRVETLRQYMKLREEAIDLTARSLRANDPVLSEQAHARMQAAQQLVERMNAEARNRK